MRPGVSPQPNARHWSCKRGITLPIAAGSAVRPLQKIERATRIVAMNEAESLAKGSLEAPVDGRDNRWQGASPQLSGGDLISISIYPDMPKVDPVASRCGTELLVRDD